jgi:CDP-2,3-bis-(O-geranylgeranyl)-sn-glycerol synthase
MFKFIFSCLYFFLPAYFVNATPPLIKESNFLKFLDRPVDFEKKFFGQPIFGSHKSWRGMILGLISGILVVFFQKFLYQFSFFKEISLIDYQKINILFFAFLISFGAIFGDLFFAFLKRRLKMKPGQRFLPFDQTNYVIGNFLFLQPYLKLNLKFWLTIFILTFFLHIIFNRLGYLLRLHKNKW